MRIYLGITGTGGKVLGSFEVGKVFEEYDKYENCIGGIDEIEIKQIIPLIQNGVRSYPLNDFKKWGYNGQKYAIEIKDFREEIFQLTSEDEYCRGCKTKFGGWQSDIEDCAGCVDGIEERYIHKFDGSEDISDLVGRLPQSFQYIHCPHTGNKAILVPIHQKWFDMIASGEKKYEFRNKLPNALKDEK